MKQIKIRNKNYNCSNAIYYHIQGLESENRLFNMEIKGHEQSEFELSKRIDKLRKEIERLQDLCNKYEEEHKTTFEEWKKAINIIKEVREELNKIDSATYQGDTDKKTYYKYEQTRIQKLLEILDKVNKEE